MEIPYTVHPRPDTGLTNPKLGIWLFLASEVMLFGGLFAGYIFMRLGAEPWMWPNGWLNVPVGTFNTFILIFSSVTIILSWECLKMRKYKAYKAWLAATWICGLLFLCVKLIVEWPEKFHHFGAYVQKDALHKYEPLLGNEDLKDAKGQPEMEKDEKGNLVLDENKQPIPVLGRLTRNKSERRFISGHLAGNNPAEEKEAMRLANIPYIAPQKLDNMIGSIWSLRAEIPRLEAELPKAKEALAAAKSKLETAKANVKKAAGEEEHLKAKTELEAAETDLRGAQAKVNSLELGLPVAKRALPNKLKLLPLYGMNEQEIKDLLDESKPEAERKELRKKFLHKVNIIYVHKVDAYNAKPYDKENDSAHFVPRSQIDVDTLKHLPPNLVHKSKVKNEKGEEVEHAHLEINKADLIAGHGAFVPKLNTYLACYFMITGLHGAHVLGGCIVFFYFWLNIKGGSKLYHTNHQQLCNRIEAAGLFWHLVDLIWIFVFPIFYLL
jgi:heme/copper-type cytochrome/quinol oxidase subunit 3